MTIKEKIISCNKNIQGYNMMSVPVTSSLVAGCTGGAAYGLAIAGRYFIQAHQESTKIYEHLLSQAETLTPDIIKQASATSISECYDLYDIATKSLALSGLLLGFATMSAIFLTYALNNDSTKAAPSLEDKLENELTEIREIK
jgi:hypothetical protein